MLTKASAAQAGINRNETNGDLRRVKSEGASDRRGLIR
jgi:hypothetical protein